jgi:hypothetical protein
MNWILLIMLTSSDYSTHSNTSSISTIGFSTKKLCEKAADKIEAPYHFDLKTECLHIDESDK